MCSTVPKVTGGGRRVETTRRLDGDAGRNVDPLLQESVAVEAIHVGLGFAEVVAPLEAGRAVSAGLGAIECDHVAAEQGLDGIADGDHLARRFGSENDRQLTLGEGHAPPAPHVDVIERHGANAHRHLVRGRWWRHVVGAEHHMPLPPKLCCPYCRAAHPHTFAAVHDGHRLS
jgi:hypothetical protein